MIVGSLLRSPQWEAVNALVTAVGAEGPGSRYLVQHSAGSGKTNTIAWTAHRLARLHTAENQKMFDKVLVISDRKVLDRQLQDAVRQVDNTADLVTTIDAAEMREAGGSKSKALAAALTERSLIVIVTIQTFPFVMKLMTDDLADKNFAVIVDEAHTSQSGATAAELRKVLAAGGVEVAEDDEISAEDVLNAKISAMTSARANPQNVSYLAFTATPKSKTLTLFGRKDAADLSGLPRAFHLYTMRQAIEEGFILDVLRGYQSYKTAFEIEQRAADGVRTVTSDEDAELVDPKAAARGIMRFVKLSEANIGQKAEIISEHFVANVAHLLEGHAKAMVVTDGRVAAVRYKRAIDKYIADKKYSLRTIVAFSGAVNDPEYGIKDATESSMNPGLGSDLAAEFRRPDYRVMIVADKFQTGFDQPLLCAMYVDKRLPDVHAVQTLSRLNRTYRTPDGEGKDTTFVLDFVNDPADIQAAFEPYYTEAAIERETDPNIVHEIAAKLAEADIYLRAEVDEFARAWFSGGSHAELAAAVKPAKDRFAARYEVARSRDDRVERERLELFRKDAGTFVRMYDFVSQVIDFGDTNLEKLCVYLRQLVRVIDVDRVATEVDLSGLVLKRVKQIDRGKASITLGSLDATLPAISGVGSAGDNQDLQLVRLVDVVARINDLFGGELGPEEIEGFVMPVAAKAQAAPGIADQIDNNAKDQFLDSRDLRESIIDAVFDVESAVRNLSDAAMADDARAEALVRIVGEFMWETRRGRKARAHPSEVMEDSAAVTPRPTFSDEGIYPPDAATRDAARAAHRNAVRTAAAAKADNGDIVECSVYGPERVAVGQTLVIQVFAHLADQAKVVEKLATDTDAEASRRASTSLDVAIKRGKRLTFELLIPGAHIDEDVRHLQWFGTPTTAQFIVTVTNPDASSTVIGKVRVAVDGVPVGHLAFKLPVGNVGGPLKLVSSDARVYRHVFISYAAADRVKVLKRVQMLTSLHVSYFQDLLSLDPGDRWERELYRHIDAADVAVQPWWRDYAAAAMSGVRAGGSHAPVVNSWVIASRVSRPHLVAVDR